MCKRVRSQTSAVYGSWAGATLTQFTIRPGMLQVAKASRNTLPIRPWKFPSPGVPAHTLFGFSAGWVPPSLSSLSPSASPLHTTPPTAAAATQPDASQTAGSASPGASSDKLEGGQALAGLRSYASDTESSSSGSGDFASDAKNETLGPFF